MDEEIRKIIEDHEQRIKALEGKNIKTEIKNSEKPISIKEFILSKKPTSDVQKTLVLGYFLEKHEGFHSFNVQDIENAFDNAKESTPKNINLCVIRNIKKGYMMESKEKKDNMKSWRLTNSGDRIIENGFQKE